MLCYVFGYAQVEQAELRDAELFKRGGNAQAGHSIA